MWNGRDGQCIRREGVLLLIRLALRNLQRNWYRTVLAVIGMALAAGSLTGALSMKSGYPEGTYKVYRQYVAGDLIAYPGRLSLEGARFESGTETRWTWATYDHTQFSDLAFFHPSMATQGFLMPEADGSEKITQADLEKLAGLPEVSGVMPYLVYPATMETAAGEYPAPLRARSAEVDARLGFSELVTQGRYFNSGDDDHLVVLVNAAPENAPEVYGTRRQYPLPKLYSWVKLRLPAIVSWVDGTPVFDYEHTTEFQFQVIGYFQLPTHEVVERVTPDPLGDRPANQLVTRQVYWESPQLLVPESTVRRLYQQLGGAEPTAFYQAGIVLDNMFRARDIATELGKNFPRWTILTVPTQVERSMATGGQTAIPADLSRVMGVAAIITAGLLVAANMYVLVTQRRRELGILKALGTSSTELLTLVLLETLGVGLLGGFIGFVFVRLVVSGMLALSDVSLTEALGLTLVAGAEVIGLTLLVSLIFGIFPAVEAVRSTTMEVLRDEE